MSSVSIVIPTYNRAQRVRAAIDSAAAQTLENVEIVVVDDGSTDDTESVVRSCEPRVTYLSQPNRGASVARNLGILHSSGDYLMFLDSDDLVYADAAAKLVSALEAHPECGAAYCGWRTVDECSGEQSLSCLDRPSGDVFLPMCTEQLCLVHSVLVRREVLALSGVFDPLLRHFEDIDLWIRVAAAAQFAFVPEHLVEYHRLESSASGLDETVAGASALMKRKLAQYRRNGRLDAASWRRVVSRFDTDFRDVWAALAFKAYERQEWREVCRDLKKGFRRDPSSLLNRGVLVLFAKSWWRGRRDAS